MLLMALSRADSVVQMRSACLIALRDIRAEMAALGKEWPRAAAVHEPADANGRRTLRSP
jgi:hypothetical protein